MIKKKKLILLPGDITSSFFLNELSYLNNCFDQKFKFFESSNFQK